MNKKKFTLDSRHTTPRDRVCQPGYKYETTPGHLEAHAPPQHLSLPRLRLDRLRLHLCVPTLLLDLGSEGIEIIEVLVAEDSPVKDRSVQEVELPERTLLISILREGKGFVPESDSVIRGGDRILAVLDPDQEEGLKAAFGTR